MFCVSETWPAWLILSVTNTSWGNFLGAVRLFTPGMSLEKKITHQMTLAKAPVVNKCFDPWQRKRLRSIN